MGLTTQATIPMKFGNHCPCLMLWLWPYWEKSLYSTWPRHGLFSDITSQPLYTAYYPYVTQLMVYLLIPFQEAIFINFCGNWTLATILNTKKKMKKKRKRDVRTHVFLVLPHAPNKLNEKQNGAKFKCIFILLTALIQIMVRAAAVHTYDF